MRAKVAEQVTESDHAETLDRLAGELRFAMGGSVTNDDVVGMLAEHAVASPALGAIYRPQPAVSAVAGFDEILARLDAEGTISALLAPLDDVYDTVRAAADGCRSATERGALLQDVHEQFLQTAAPDTVRKLGIVYTPPEIVRFMLRSADIVCRRRFGVGLTAEGVEVIDPFAGTGTYLAGLFDGFRSDGGRLVADGDVLRKYSSEVRASELVPLACRAAEARIAAVVSERLGAAAEPFTQMRLRDTMLAPPAGLLDAAATDRQPPKVRVLVFNPPWGVGVKSARDTRAAVRYPHLERRVYSTYSRRQRCITGRPAGKSSNNQYVQAIRWASDQLTDSQGRRIPGVVAVVHPNSLCDAATLAGMRAALTDEFCGIWVVNLLGDAARTGTDWHHQGDKVFGSASRNGVQITVLVSGPEPGNAPAALRYAEVPPGSTRGEKLQWLDSLVDITAEALEPVAATTTHHWAKPADDNFAALTPVCEHRGVRTTDPPIAPWHTLGVETKLSTYVLGFDRAVLETRMRKFIDAYETARTRVRRREATVEEIAANGDHTEIAWTGPLRAALRSGGRAVFDADRIRPVLFRPFTKAWLYDDPLVVASIDTAAAMIPDSGDFEAIIVTPHRQQPFGVLAAGELIDFCLLGRAGRCVPRRAPAGPRRSHRGASLLDVDAVFTDNIASTALDQFQHRYSADITTDDIWEYLYGVMHAPDWLTRHSDELRRSLPRIPLADDFEAFRAAGRRLLDLHIGYETAKPLRLRVEIDGTPVSDRAAAEPEALRMRPRMRWAPPRTGSRPDAIIVSDRCRLLGIPQQAHDYLVAGRSPLQWALDSLRLKHDKKSGITDDPNGWHAWADDPFELIRHLRRLAAVSVESAAVIAGLPSALTDSA